MTGGIENWHACELCCLCNLEVRDPPGKTSPIALCEKLSAERRDELKNTSESLNSALKLKRRKNSFLEVPECLHLHGFHPCAIYFIVIPLSYLFKRDLGSET